MSDETKASIDPRFDPAFQRGFDPASPTAEGVRSRSAASPAASSAAPRIAPPPSPAAAQTPTPAAVAAPAPAETPQATLDAAVIAETPATQSGRNPYLLVLAIIAVILVIVGIWLFTQSGSQFNSKAVRSQGDYVSLDATIHAAPFVSLLGAATAIGVVFVFAAQWRRRK